VINPPDAAPAMITVSTLNGLSGVRHGFFTREGGDSEGPFASLNCSLSVGDAADRVLANRARALARFDVDGAVLLMVAQRHTADVVVVDTLWAPGAEPVADGLVTNRPGVALGILGADCAPILLIDPRAKVIGAAHAGWRGALSGVIGNTIAAMVGLGASPSRVIAAIGPCIGQQSYEVGADFSAPFLADDPANAIFFARGRDTDHLQFDLPGYIGRCLGKLAVDKVVRTPCDTFREDNRFFSHRRAVLAGNPQCGRALSAIMFEP